MASWEEPLTVGAFVSNVRYGWSYLGSLFYSAEGSRPEDTAAAARAAAAAAAAAAAVNSSARHHRSPAPTSDYDDDLAIDLEG